MTDIDFDELDKAVNSLMGTVGSKEKEDEPKEKTFTVSNTLQPGEKPQYDRLGEVAKQIGNETLVGESELTIIDCSPDSDASTSDANGGATGMERPADAVESEPIEESQVDQESDRASPITEVVAGSELQPKRESDMQSETEMAPEPEKLIAPAVKRPTGGRFMDVVHPSSDMRSSGTPALNVPERSHPEVESSQTSSPTAEPNSEALLVESSVQDQVATSDIVSPTPSGSSIPLTPFLPDAKVEKRPLGESPAATNTSDDEQSELTKESNDSNQKSDAQRPLDASDYSANSATENQELQRVESTGTAEDVVTPEPSTDVTAADMPDTAPSSGPSIQQIESGDTEHLSGGLHQAPIATDQPSDTNGDVYGVKEHGPTLDHPAKQKSGWGTVVIIILIIIALAGVGAATYFMLGMGS